MLIRFEARQELAAGIWQYSFLPERPVDFEPGQYVDVSLPVQNDTRGQSRTFTLTSLPSDESMSFVLKHFSLQSPYKQVLQQLKPGDSATISDAMGDLILPKDPRVPLVFIAGGIGMASYASMFRRLLAQREERAIYFYYSLRAHREQIFSELSSAYPLQLSQLVIAPNSLTAPEIKDTTPPDALLYISGSQSFVENLRGELEILGTPRSQIVFDYYEGYAEL